MLLIIGNHLFIELLRGLYGCELIIVGSTSLIFQDIPVTSHTDFDVVIRGLTHDSKPNIFRASIFASQIILTTYNMIMVALRLKERIELPKLFPFSNIIKLAYKQNSGRITAILDISFKYHPGVPEISGVKKEIKESDILDIPLTITSGEESQQYYFRCISVPFYITETYDNIKFYMSNELNNVRGSVVAIDQNIRALAMYCIKGYDKLLQLGYSFDTPSDKKMITEIERIRIFIEPPK
jgi:hypothetical protein